MNHYCYQQKKNQDLKLYIEHIINMKLQENIQRIKEMMGVINEENRFQKMGEDKYKSCSMSDITRMEIIDIFFNRVKENPDYHKEKPDFDLLTDNWDGYDDQVYIQNKLDDDTIIFYEGWVDSCWDAVHNKQQYQGMNKEQVMEDIIKNRFPRIGDEFNMLINDYGYFYHNGYIMYVTFTKK